MFILHVSFRNPGTFSRRTDVDLTTLHVLYLASLVIFAVGGLERRSECAVAICLLICELSYIFRRKKQYLPIYDRQQMKSEPT